MRIKWKSASGFSATRRRAVSFSHRCYAQQGTISLLTRTLPLDSFESRDTIILPGAQGGQDALYAFPPEQDKKLDTLAERLGSLGERRWYCISTLGSKLLGIYRIPVSHLPNSADPVKALQQGGAFLRPAQQARAQWGNEFELIGYSVEAADQAHRNLMVTVFLRALNPMSTDYTFSVKASDAKNRAWGQEDKWAGDNSFATSEWKPGDVIVERFYPGLDACAPAGNYRLTIEAYDPKSGQALALANASDTRFGLTPWNVQSGKRESPGGFGPRAIS